MKNKIILKSIGAGIAGTISIALIYFLILTWVSGDWRHPVDQFLLVKFWMGALFLGFGVQLGLFWFVKLVHRENKANKVAGTSAGMSTATMIACCAHHITDLVPILGLTAAGIFLARYQVYILMLAIIFNLLGMIYMLNIIKKHQLYKFNFQNI